MKTANDLLEENNVCRQIFTELRYYGLNQRQTKMLIYLLSHDLEDRELSLEISSLVRDDVMISEICASVETDKR